MPGLDGIGLLDAAMRQAADGGPSFLFVTGGVPARALAEAVERSGVTLLEKALRKQGLEGAFERILSRRHLGRTPSPRSSEPG